MISTIALGVLIYTNARLAKKKGKSPIAWGLLSFFAFFFMLMVCLVFYMVMVYNGPQTISAIQASLKENPLRELLLEFLGLGGPLLLRYILERSEERSPS